MCSYAKRWYHTVRATTTPSSFSTRVYCQQSASVRYGTVCNLNHKESSTPLETSTVLVAVADMPQSGTAGPDCPRQTETETDLKKPFQKRFLWELLWEKTCGRERLMIHLQILLMTRRKLPCACCNSWNKCAQWRLKHICSALIGSAIAKSNNNCLCDSSVEVFTGARQYCWVVPPSLTQV